MRFNRPMLYVGTFLAAIGGVAVAADAGALDTTTIADIVRLWPLAVVAIGVALVTRRTRFSLAAGLLAAAVPGLLLGSSFAIIPRFAGDCGARGEPVTVADERGTFDGAGTIQLETGCGSLAVTTAPGNGWALAAASTVSVVPFIGADPHTLTISGGTGPRAVLSDGRDAWTLTVPTSPLDALLLEINASRSRIALPGADISTLVIAANLSDVVVDAGAASIGDLSASLVMSNLSLHLPAGRDFVGSIRIGGGDLQICAPPDVGLFVSSRGFARERADGFGAGFGAEFGEYLGSNWLSANYDTAAYHADIDLRANFSTVAINPIGGCR